MADDFIDADPFDPEVARQLEDVQYESAVEGNERLSGFIRRRKQAYAAVFSEGPTDKADIEFVMLDLALFCRAYSPTFNPHNSKIQDLLEGRREVFQRVKDYTTLTHDQLYAKYTDAMLKGREQ